MKRAILCVVFLFPLLAALLFAQRPRPAVYPPWEVRALFPAEVSPARYRQVDPREIDRLAADGWELVSTTPFTYLNEERGPEGRKLVVTQTYPAYFFKRPRLVTQQEQR